jgi:hypothetical protein
VRRLEQKLAIIKSAFLVLQFGDVEKARAFVNNKELVFDGKPFFGVLMSTIKDDIGKL